MSCFKCHAPDDSTCCCEPMIEAPDAHSDLRDIMKVVGLSTHARPISSHAVVQKELLPLLRRHAELIEMLRVMVGCAEPQFPGGQHVSPSASYGSPQVRAFVLREIKPLLEYYDRPAPLTRMSSDRSGIRKEKATGQNEESQQELKQEHAAICRCPRCEKGESMIDAYRKRPWERKR